MLPSHASGACKQHAQPKRTLNVSIRRADIRTQLAHANHIFDIGSGKPHYPIHFVDVSTNGGIFDEYQENFDMSWRKMIVHYTTENCTQYNQTVKIEGWAIVPWERMSSVRYTNKRHLTVVSTSA